MDVAIFQWAKDALGFPLAIVAVLWWYGIKNKDTKPDIARELISKIDAIDSKVGAMGERVARIEGKLSND